MKWWLVKIVYLFIYGNGKHIAQFNEQLRMITAEDELHAFQKARLIGEREATTVHYNDIQLSWKFIDVIDISAVSNIKDGEEIWSVINEETDAAMYIRSTQQQSKALLEKGILDYNSLNETGIGKK